MDRQGFVNRIRGAHQPAVQSGGIRRCLLALWPMAILSAVLAVSLAESPGAALAQSQASEYHVKAAFLFHFVQLVEWPAGSLGNEINPVTLCTMGDDPFHGDLDDTLAGKSVGTRRLRVRHLKPAEDLQGCQVLFVSETDAAGPASRTTEGRTDLDRWGIRWLRPAWGNDRLLPGGQQGPL